MVDDDNDDDGAWVYYKLTYEPLAQVSKKSNIPNDLAKIVNFHFSHYKSMET